MKQKFKTGDLVRIKENTHDSSLPENRLGLIVERLDRFEQDRLQPSYTHIWVIMMTNGKSLRFHEMFLEHAPKENEDDREKK
jgi:hypothetical protein